MKDSFKWVIQIEVDESWVADGFDMTDERVKEMLARETPYAYGHELEVKVLKSPSVERIMKKQGYTEKDIAATLAH